VCFLSGKYAEAEAALRKALEIDPTLADAHNNLGAVYDRTGRKDEAEREFRLAIADPVYPTPQKAYLNLGLLYGSAGRDSEAIHALRQAVEIDPKYYQAHYELAALLDRTGSLDEAVREYEVAAPDYQSSGEYFYRLGFGYFRLGNRAKAREALARAIEVSPGSEAAARSDEVLKLLR
jgi:Tfp pilus assembly protein PilF